MRDLSTRLGLNKYDPPGIYLKENKTSKYKYYDYSHLYII